MTESTPVERSAKYNDIVSAAQALFGEVGYDKTGVREIAERAPLALGTLYSYFPDGKAGVLAAALNERVARLAAYVSHTGETDPVDAFFARVRRLNGEVVRDPFLRRIFADQDRVTEPRLRERGREIIDQFGAQAVAELRRLTSRGAIRCDDPEAVAVLLRVANSGWIAAHPGVVPGVQYDRFLDVLVDSVRALVRVAR